MYFSMIHVTNLNLNFAYVFAIDLWCCVIPVLHLIFLKYRIIHFRVIVKNLLTIFLFYKLKPKFLKSFKNLFKFYFLFIYFILLSNLVTSLVSTYS